jgi:hypothetical protein
MMLAKIQQSDKNKTWFEKYKLQITQSSAGRFLVF